MLAAGAGMAPMSDTPGAESRGVGDAGKLAATLRLDGGTKVMHVTAGEALRGGAAVAGPASAFSLAARGLQVPYTLHPTPCTLHPAPYTLHPTPFTLHPTPYTSRLSWRTTRRSCCW